MCEYEFHFISANETKIGMDEGRKTPKMKLFHRNLTILLCVPLDIVKEERLIIKHWVLTLKNSVFLMLQGKISRGSCKLYTVYSIPSQDLATLSVWYKIN